MDKFLIACFTLLLSPVWADIIIVSSTQDSGPGTLRSAIDEANMTTGKDTIHFTISDTVFLTTAASTNGLLLPQITDTLYIDGNDVTLKAVALGRHLQISAPCEITDLSFSNGIALLTGGAVRVLSSADMVTFTRCHFIGNHAPDSGGGLLTDCPADLIECSFMANTSAAGGGLALREGILPISVQLDNCFFSDNTASSQGAAVHLEGGILQIKTTVFESTIGAFTEDIFIKVSANTGEVELLPGFEVVPQPGGLIIERS